MQEHILIDNIKTLNQVNFQIAELLKMKEKLETVIIDEIGHTHFGTKTYKYGVFSVEITTPLISTLDIEKYKLVKDSIPKQLNPITQSTVYKICKKKLKYINSMASKEDLLFLGKFIVDKPGKKKIKLGANV